MCIRDRFNPDLLLKDELCYEALLRGLPHANVTVTELRKTLRESRSDTPTQLGRLSELDYESEREMCYAKYRELTLLSCLLYTSPLPINVQY